MSKAQTIERAKDPRKTALLTAVLRNLEAQAIDDALDLFALLMATRLISPARRRSERERLTTTPQLERASRTLARVSRILVRELEQAEQSKKGLNVAAIWAAVGTVASREAVNAAVVLV